MNIRPVRTEEDLTWALGEVEAYFVNQPDKGSEDAVRFEILADLIRAYEALHWAIEEPAEDVRKKLVYRGVTYADQASLRAAIKTDHTARMLKRKSGPISSSGRWVSRFNASAKRARRPLKAG
jgi:antitoxin component HigA of HigAB toxin-antitoxin module